MEKTILVLPDGRQLSSGVPGETAIQSCTVTCCVNTGTELAPGAVCAAMAEIKLLTPTGTLPIAAGDVLTLCRDDGTNRRQLGLFIAEKPTRTGAHGFKLTAYDRISLLDRDLTAWLEGLTGWPYSLYTLSCMVCAACGLTLQNTQIPNGSFPVEKFSAGSITGRRLLQWAAEAAGCFCRATAEGNAEFAWYTPAGCTLGPAPAQTVTYKAGVLTICDPALTACEKGSTLYLNAPHWDFSEAGVDIRQTYYLGGSLTCADYTVAPIEKVQLNQDREDVGAVWPNDPEAANALTLTGNLLLAGAQKEALQGLAQSLYDRLKGITYTPCRVTLPAGTDIRAGHIVSLIDPVGRAHTLYVMSSTRTGQRLTLECTGSARRDSVSAVNEQSYTALSGQLLRLRTNIEGIRAQNRNADGRIAALSLSVDGLSAQVEKQTAAEASLQRELTGLQQTAKDVQITVQTICQQGVSKVQTGMGYTFNDEGLQIARQGEQMENRLDNTGMYVRRGAETILQANNDGVVAADVTVHNYLRVGHSRLERYEDNRTACFYIGIT